MQPGAHRGTPDSFEQFYGAQKKSPHVSDLYLHEFEISHPQELGEGKTEPAERRVLPRASLPAYELPPDYLVSDLRRCHEHYKKDLGQFVIRVLYLQRGKPSDQLGFNIRGGCEQNSGVFISKVMPNTEAHRIGLKEGDQIIAVNGENFLSIEHTEAVRILKKHTAVELTVKYFPYGYAQTYERRHT